MPPSSAGGDGASTSTRSRESGRACAHNSLLALETVNGMRGPVRPTMRGCPDRGSGGLPLGGQAEAGTEADLARVDDIRESRRHAQAGANDNLAESATWPGTEDSLLWIGRFIVDVLCVEESARWRHQAAPFLCRLPGCYDYTADAAADRSRCG